MADYVTIRAALEKGLDAFNNANPLTFLAPDGVTPVYNNQVMDIAWENTSYVPEVGRPYQEVALLPAVTQQPGNGYDGTRFDSGVFQISLYYPRDGGAGDAAGRADLLRNYFTRRLQLSHNGVYVQVERTPSISPAMTSDSWYKLVVSVPYFIYS